MAIKKTLAIMVLAVSLSSMLVDAHGCDCDEQESCAAQCVAPCCVNASKITPSISTLDLSESVITILPFLHEPTALPSPFIKTIFRPPRSV